MCGFVGKLYFNRQKGVSGEDIKRMMEKVHHRGPDQSGFVIENNLGLGHKRLSIIDLSLNARQPMVNEDKSCLLVFNGEIYNFQELRKRLIEKGHKFISNTDSEVILHLYEDHGEKCLDFLRGMFAFAIFDKRKNKLFLARDRLGQKPLKYYIDDKVLIFSSELKAILKNEEVKKEVDFEAIHHYLSYQYVPDSLTGFKGIKKLLPAHYLVWQNGSIEIKRYWKLDFSKKENFSEKEWGKMISEKLMESVKIRLVSDVPLGVFLSGGIDSSCIVALASKISSTPISTFSVGFREKGYNELRYASIIAKKFNTEHHELMVKPDVIKDLSDLVYFYEEPYADPSALPTFYVARAARKHIKVVLSGDGGDENFAGYTHFNYFKLISEYAKNPSILKKILPSLLAKLPFATSSFFERIKGFLRKSSLPLSLVYFELIQKFTNLEKENLYTDWFLKKTNKYYSSQFIKKAFSQSNTQDALDNALYTNFTTYLPDDLLVKADIATMANALELRSPFLDQEFVELCAKIPSHLKIKNNQNKYILKRAFESILPKEILNREKKGFAAPIAVWFKKELKEYAENILLSEKLYERGIFKKEEVKKIFDSHSKKGGQGKKIWQLLTLELWFRTFFD